ncbi:MAG: hypothetical protein MUC60_10020 [Oscillatoria sp. Prado101]|nr:hypothetical protein [Oscillatoria sp. Prado101]
MTCPAPGQSPDSKSGRCGDGTWELYFQALRRCPTEHSESLKIPRPLPAVHCPSRLEEPRPWNLAMGQSYINLP